jgi:hypothetical protein
MDSTIKRILGEAEDDTEKPDKKKKKSQPKGKTAPPSKSESEPETETDREQPDRQVPEEAEIEELANLWTQGNRNEVVRRFMQMDNETAVKVVFVIGREGALELGRMVDDMLEQMGDQEGVTPPSEFGSLPAGGRAEAPSTEPISVEHPSAEEDYPARQIMGGSR